MEQNQQSPKDNVENRIDWLKEELDEGNLSTNQLELAAYLGDIDAKTLVDRNESTDVQDLRSWLYGLNMGGKAALVRICSPFARDCLKHWHSVVNGETEWFNKLPTEEWFGSLSKAIDVSEQWILQPSLDRVRLARKCQQQLYEILCQIELLCREGDFPDEGFYMTQVAYYTIEATVWTVDEAAAGYLESGNMEKVEAIANAGPAYEMVEAVTIANKILNQTDDEIRSSIQDILLPWIFNPHRESVP